MKENEEFSNNINDEVTKKNKKYGLEYKSKNYSRIVLEVKKEIKKNYRKCVEANGNTMQTDLKNYIRDYILRNYDKIKGDE